MTPLDQIQQQLAESWLIGVLAGIALYVIASRGWLRPRALLVGPSRAIGLGPSDLLIALGLMVIGMALLSAVVGNLVPLDPETGAPAADASLAAQARLVLLSQLFTQVPPVVYLVWRAAQQPGGLIRLGLLPRRPARELATGLGALLVAMPLVMFVLLLASVIGTLIGLPAPQMAHDLLPSLQQPGEVPAKLALVLAVAVVAPIVEEVIYRGLLQSALVETFGRRGRWTALVLASALFASVHIPSVPIHALPALFVLAVIMGWLYERTGSLWPSIIVHAGFNAFNILMVMLVIPAQP